MNVPTICFNLNKIHDSIEKALRTFNLGVARLPTIRSSFDPVKFIYTGSVLNSSKRSSKSDFLPKGRRQPELTLFISDSSISFKPFSL
jgi:hypothetical protein